MVSRIQFRFLFQIPIPIPILIPNSKWTTEFRKTRRFRNSQIPIRIRIPIPKSKWQNPIPILKSIPIPTTLNAPLHVTIYTLQTTTRHNVKLSLLFF